MKSAMTDELYDKALGLLRRLVAVRSFSGEESFAADIMEEFFAGSAFVLSRHGENVIVRSRHFDEGKPIILLNSHLDTVRPVHGWTLDPFVPHIRDEKLYGLGSNDAGGALCSLAVVFHHVSERRDLPFNLVFAATAEEETAGRNGIESVLPHLGRIDMAIVGEPTNMELAIAERGLLVLDCTAHGVAGHAARDIGVNAIDIALKDIQWLHSYRFGKTSALLGDVKMTVTGISGGIQHNVIPDRCTFYVDIRVTDCYTHEEILSTIRSNIASAVEPRSMRLRPSIIEETHVLVQSARKLGVPCFASPTMSDQALVPVPSVKIGPGKSERSHTPDEFILLEELRRGIDGYITFLEQISMEMTVETLDSK